jgi:hypothetical protein
MPQFKINGALINPSTVTGALYANQNETFATDAQDTQILYYANGAPTSTPSLTYDGTGLTLDGELHTTGNVGITGTVEIHGNVGIQGTTNVAIGPNPSVSPAIGPLLLNRGNATPIFWNSTFVVTSEISAGFNPGNTAIGGRNYLDVAGGPYISSTLSAQVFGYNGNPGANRDFFVLAANMYTATYDDIPANGRVGSVQLWCRGDNEAPARANVCVLFVPPN